MGNRSWDVTLQANFIQHEGYTIVYRRYASLFFMVGIDDTQVGAVCFCHRALSTVLGRALSGKLRVQSPMMIWEFIHRLVEMLNKTFENVSELDIMINSGLVCLVILSRRRPNSLH